MKLSVFVFQSQPPLMPLLPQGMCRLPARGRLFSASASPLGRAASLALAHAASELPRLSIARAPGQALAVKRQGKKRRPFEAGRIEIKLATRVGRTLLSAAFDFDSSLLSREPVAPLQKLPKCRATMAVIRFLFRAEFGKCFLNLRKIKQRVVPEAVPAARRIQNHSLGRPAKGCESPAIARGG